MTLHFGFNLVPGIDGFEQSTFSPLRIHFISKESDTIGGHFPGNTNKLFVNLVHGKHRVRNSELNVIKYIA